MDLGFIDDIIPSKDIKKYYSEINYNLKLNEIIFIILTQNYIPTYKKIEYLKKITKIYKNTKNFEEKIMVNKINKLLLTIISKIRNFKRYYKYSFYEIVLCCTPNPCSIENNEHYGYFKLNSNINFDAELNIYLKKIYKLINSKNYCDKRIFQNISITKNSLLPIRKVYSFNYKIDLNGKLVSNWFDLDIQLDNIINENWNIKHPFKHGDLVKDILTNEIGIVAQVNNNGIVINTKFGISDDIKSPFTLIYINNKGV